MTKLVTRSNLPISWLGSFHSPELTGVITTMRIIPTLLISFFSHLTIADMVNEHAAIKCSDGSAYLITGFINHSPTWENTWPPEIFKLEPLTCKTKKDQEIRFVVTEGKQSLRGSCGLNPKQTISVQVNSTVLYTTLLSPKCGGLLVKSIKAGSGELEVCTYSEVNYAAPWVNITEPDYTCTRMPLDKLTNPEGAS